MDFRKPYAAPFGRYVGGTEAEPPANEVLIGREGQRAYFIDILLRAGRRGVFLVTGNRGVGKTSFVRYCLKEYEDEVFERFLRSDVGRAFFWDRLFIAALGFGALCAALMLSEFLEILVLAATRRGDSASSGAGLLAWPMMAPIVVLCLYPLIYAWEVLSEILGSAPVPSVDGAIRSVPVSPLVVPVLTLVLAAVVGSTPPIGASLLSRLGHLFFLMAELRLIWIMGLCRAARAAWRTPLWVLTLLPIGLVPWITAQMDTQLGFSAHLGAGFMLTAAATIRLWRPRFKHPAAAGTTIRISPRVARDVTLGGTAVAQVALCVWWVWSHRQSLTAASIAIPLISAIVLVAASFCWLAHRQYKKRRRAPKGDPSWGQLFRKYATLLSPLLTVGLAIAFWFLPFFGAPAYSLSYLFFVMAEFHFAMAEWERRRSKSPWLFLFWVLVAASLGIVPWITAGVDPRDAFYVHLGTGFLLAAGGTFRSRSPRGVPSGNLDADDSAPSADRSVGSGRSRTLGVTAFVLALLFTWAIYQVRDSLDVLMAWLAFVIALNLFAVALCRWRRRGHDAVPTTAAGGSSHAIVVLSLKVVLSIAVCLQLLHPLLAVAVGAHRDEVPTGDKIRRPLALHFVIARHMATENVTTTDTRGRAHVKKSVKAIDHGLMDAPNEELWWIISLWLCVLWLYYLEYEVVLRPFLAGRSCRVITKYRPARGAEGSGLADDRRRLQGLARVTLPWILYRAWLPTLTVSVNLGFERLDHRRVIQAMLVGLQARYRRLFLAWNSGLANLGRLVALLALLGVVSLLGDRLFKLPDLRPSEVYAVERENYRNLCSVLEGAQQSSGIGSVICATRWGDSILQFLYFNLTEATLWGDENFEALNQHLLLRVLPYQRTAWPADNRPFLSKGMSFRVYHLILFVVLLIVGRWLARRVPIVPYREVQRRIDVILDSLTGSTSVTSRIGRWQPAQWLEGFLIGERVRQINQEPFDPRSVEYLFLHVLEEIQLGAIRLPGARRQLFSLPVPEITFVFDELDKLGTRIDPNENTGAEPQQAEILNAERRRSLELHKLLADLKNLLASAPAKFVFVGGRNLHDEWLADQTSRLPLLTSIFDAEVYLPSLLAEGSARDGEEATRLDRNIVRFVEASIDRAKRIYELSAARRRMPAFGLKLEQREPDAFLDDLRRVVDDRHVNGLEILELDGTEPVGAKELASDFVEFLAYRSMGNPQRLRELLGSFVRPLWRVIPGKYGKKFPCDHVLAFDDEDRFRIQLIAKIYRHLQRTFDRGFARRDDKMTVSVFYLSDFLFKFHRRAFSWANLERVEDMVHIHRAPDLREVLATMVEQWSERFLHPIRNGMYDFRFRSEVAREVDYISRHAPTEMAAFNFTLDESQALKSVYETSAKRLKEGSGKELQDLVAGLGELHEFDQEYETARLFYRKAVALLDLELRAVTGGSEFLEVKSPMLQIMGGEAPGPANTRQYLTWGIARLRLILQIGLTLELSRNYERAGVEYGNASTLARSLLLALVDEVGRDNATLDAIPCSERTPANRLHALKHLNLLFQPVFAEAWISEKLAAAVDTSVSLVERELWELRQILPFVRDAETLEADSAVAVRHSNFALIVAELHNKAGDLLFFKGRGLVSDKMVKTWAATDAVTDLALPRHGAEGYLLRAHYHYAVALHELRRFTAYRKASSVRKLNILEPGPGQPLWPTFVDGIDSWPDYVLRSLGGTLNDFAEVMIGRVSLFGLLKCLRDRILVDRTIPLDEPSRESAIAPLFAAFTNWMQQRSDASKVGLAASNYPIRIPLGAGVLEAGTLGGWLGRWNEGWERERVDQRLIRFYAEGGRRHDDLDRIGVALSFRVIGARYLEKGGYAEDAAREFVKIAETASAYLWLLHTIQRLVSWNRQQLEPDPVLNEDQKLLTAEVRAHGLWGHLENVALYSLERADRLFRRGRIGVNRKYLVGDRIPVDALIVACSLGLRGPGFATDPNRAPSPNNKRLGYLISGWTGTTVDVERASLRAELARCIERHSYPMLSRLNGLKTLIDDRILHPLPEDAPPGPREAPLNETMELIGLAESFDSPLHFTPAQVGITAALTWIFAPGGDQEKAERLRRLAQRELTRSQEMYSLRRAFYENISDLYYLFDDLNDRQVHFGHALQMASSELVSLLRGLVNRRDRDRISRTPLVVGEDLPKPTAAAAQP